MKLLSCGRCQQRARIEFASNVEAMNFGRSHAIPSFWWVLVRLILFVYTAGLLLWEVESTTHRKLFLFPIYATHWTNALIAIYQTFAFYISIVYARQLPKFSFSKLWDITKVLVYVTWTAQNICGPGALLIAALYWTLVYKSSDGLPTALTINSHGGTFIAMALDFFLSAAPFRLLHIWCIGCFIAAYYVFLVVYFFLSKGHTVVYAALNFNDFLPSVIISVLLFFVALPVAVFIFWSIKQLGMLAFEPPYEEGDLQEDDDLGADKEAGDLSMHYPNNTRIHHVV